MFEASIHVEREILQGAREYFESALSGACPTYYYGRQVIIENKETGLYGLFKDVVGVVIMGSTIVTEPIRVIWDLCMSLQALLFVAFGFLLVTIPVYVIQAIGSFVRS